MPMMIEYVSPGSFSSCFDPKKNGGGSSRDSWRRRGVILPTEQQVRQFSSETQGVG
jgi:hypothetical protein